MRSSLKPEKALLDLIYLPRRGSDDPAYLSELRLQNLDRLDAVVPCASSPTESANRSCAALQRPRHN